MNKKYLFLDDERMPGDVTWILIGGVGSWGATWDIVRSFAEATDWVIKYGCPDVISFDHDLGAAHYANDYSDGKTGYDFCKFLIDYDINNNVMPADFSFTVHSKNPIGKENIETLLNNYLNYKRHG